MDELFGLIAAVKDLDRAIEECRRGEIKPAAVDEAEDRVIETAERLVRELERLSSVLKDM